MTEQSRRRVTIDAPSQATILAARHLDATEGPVQVGSIVDTSTRFAIDRVLAYVAKAHNSPTMPAPDTDTADQPPAHGCAIDGQPAMPILVSEHTELVARAALMDLRVKQAAELRVRLADAEEGITAAIRQRKEAEARAQRAEAELRRYTEAESADAAAGSYAGRAEQAEQRLRLAHQARRGKEHQLDGIRRALCDIGAMQDDDPYSHADLEDVIRQTFPKGDSKDAAPTTPDLLAETAAMLQEVAPAAPGAEPDTVTDPAWLSQQYAKAIAADDGHPWDTLSAGRQESYLDNADAVMRVRDRHLEQLRQRLTLAEQVRRDDLAETERLRARLGAALACVKLLKIYAGGLDHGSPDDIGPLVASRIRRILTGLDDRPQPEPVSGRSDTPAARDGLGQHIVNATLTALQRHDHWLPASVTHAVADEVLAVLVAESP